MPLLSASQMAAIQKMGERTFTVSVDLYARQAYGADDANPFGDDTVTWAVTPVTVQGWLVPTDTTDFMVSSAQVLSAGNFVLRVPSGTAVEPGDKATIESKDYYVSESTTEQTWPEWITVRLRRTQ